MGRIVVFGAGKIAEVALAILAERGEHEVVAFCVDAGHVPETGRFRDRPAVSFADAVDRFPPDSHGMIVALGYHDCNGLRAARMAVARDAGYALLPCASPRAMIARDVEVPPGAVITEGACVQAGVSLAPGVIVFGPAAIGHHTRVGECCWMASGSAIGGDAALGPQCFVGLNATIANGVTLGRRCFVGAATLVIRDAPDESVFARPETERQRVDTTRFMKLTKFR